MLINSPLFNEMLERARLKTYPLGQIVMYAGDSPSEVYIVKSGYVKVYDVDENGNEKILSIVKPGDIMPYSFFSGADVPNKWFYQALCDAKLYILDRDTLRRAMYADSSLTLAMVGGFSREVHELLTRLSSMGKTRTSQKLVALMKYFVVCLGANNKISRWWRVPFPVTQQLLADITGMTRESCSSGLKQLSEAGILRQRKTNSLEINTKKLFKITKYRGL